MKLLLLLSAILLIGCDEAGNPDGCFRAVKNTYPNATIFKVANRKFMFLVADSSGNLLQVSTLSTSSTAITKVDTLTELR